MSSRIFMSSQKEKKIWQFLFFFKALKGSQDSRIFFSRHGSVAVLLGPPNFDMPGLSLSFFISFLSTPVRRHSSNLYESRGADGQMCNEVSLIFIFIVELFPMHRWIVCWLCGEAGFVFTAVGRPWNVHRDLDVPSKGYWIFLTLVHDLGALKPEIKNYCNYNFFLLHSWGLSKKQ